MLSQSWNSPSSEVAVPAASQRDEVLFSLYYSSGHHLFLLARLVAPVSRRRYPSASTAWLILNALLPNVRQIRRRVAISLAVTTCAVALPTHAQVKILSDHGELFTITRDWSRASPLGYLRERPESPGPYTVPHDQVRARLRDILRQAS